jgi:hypothetical protein
MLVFQARELRPLNNGSDTNCRELGMALRKSMARTLPVLLLLCLASCSAAPIAVSPSTVGSPRSGKDHELYEPAGPGPHAAVLVLHGCSGITPTVRGWAATLAEWGYFALVLDSFGPRGVQNVCDRPEHVSAWVRAGMLSRASPICASGQTCLQTAYLWLASRKAGTRPSSQPHDRL